MGNSLPPSPSLPYIHPPSLSFPLFYRIVNSELTHFKGALSTLENINDFGSALFDVWIVNR